ncbi:hypothetical protein KUL25_19545 [Rhodobacteraceae bacterium N5(2021)]|uniref:Uncharacterized protein n=1 Tax=Gymnodinialimonas phycosphaerae TaxID=2841589 RepID=A0A975TUR9_9RHOB|nr:hypothetical protein [Gymnodinialimonas phycosphaerae]MBY4894959.1 hypothetical protein [Gymnodinialimonas phycosphaerae]
MVYQFAIVALAVAALGAPIAAQQTPYDGFPAEVAEGDGGACRRLVIAQAIARLDGTSPLGAFASVEAIMADILGGPEFEAAGCDPDYRFEVLACASIDDPTLTHIVPRGVVVATVPERIALMRFCLDRAAAGGLKPGARP